MSKEVNNNKKMNKPLKKRKIHRSIFRFPMN